MPALATQFTFVINTGSFTATSVSIPSAALSITSGTVFLSNPQKGDGYFGSADGLHTVTYTVTPNFEGTLTMQATLATMPAEVDWFNVDNSAVVYGSPVPSTTTTNYINFTGNFVWVRVKAHRSANPTNGSVSFINFNR